MSSSPKRGRPVHGILLYDKPIGCSSNQALQRVKRLFDAQKAGHTGSLDPLATGMLPLCFGEATKVCGYLLDADKTYITGAQLGLTTNTGDAEGVTLDQKPVPDGLTLADIERAAFKFIGQIDQVPPMYSALKIDGKRLYKLARAGIEVERVARRIHIFSIDVLSLKDDVAVLQVSCSKGTYIRTLVEDIGAALGCGAHVVSLRRLTVASFDEVAMVGQPQLEELAEAGVEALDQLLLPPDQALEHLDRIDLAVPAASRFRQGQTVVWDPDNSLKQTQATTPEAAIDGLCRVYCDAEFLGIADMDAGGLKPRRLFHS